MTPSLEGWPTKVKETKEFINLSGGKIQGIPKKYSENFVDYFHPTKNRLTESLSMQNLFHSIVMHSKTPI